MVRNDLGGAQEMAGEGVCTRSWAEYDCKATCNEDAIVFRTSRQNFSLFPDISLWDSSIPLICSSNNYSNLWCASDVVKEFQCEFFIFFILDERTSMKLDSISAPFFRGRILIKFVEQHWEIMLDGWWFVIINKIMLKVWYLAVIKLCLNYTFLN